MREPKVSVIMMTYQHEKSIKKAIEGVLMQKTNFPVELIIADDASPDDTQKIVNQIIKENNTAHIIKYTKHQQNKGIHQNFFWAYRQTKGKYIALCEGDDFWTDKNKLQKQVDFLEQHPEYILCGTDVTRVATATGQVQPRLNKKFGDITLDDILYRNQMTTCTVVFKKIDFNTQLISNFDRFTVGDLPLWCSLLRYGKGYNMKDVTAQYNIHQGGMVSGRSLNNTLFSKLNDRLLLLEEFPGKKQLIKKHGNRIILHYIKNALLLKKAYISSLWQHKSLILKYLLK